MAERPITLFDIPGCANDIGMGRCDDCRRRYDLALIRQQRRIRRRLRRAKRRLASDEDRCAGCRGTGWVSSETGESISTDRLGYRSDAVECAHCDGAGRVASDEDDR